MITIKEITWTVQPHTDKSILNDIRMLHDGINDILIGQSYPNHLLAYWNLRNVLCNLANHKYITNGIDSINEACDFELIF